MPGVILIKFGMAFVARFSSKGEHTTPSQPESSASLNISNTVFSILLLKKGNKVLGIDSMNNYYDVNLKKARLNILKKYKDFSFIKTNLEKEKKIKNVFIKFKPDFVIHLAAQAGVRYSIDKPRVYLKSNIEGTFNIIEASYQVGVKHLIMASSSSVYGANKNIPFKEIDKTETQLSIYAATK
ncbi:MAG: GDP-mannose 4,6-dehydratase, partial [Gammaproteobacteria bacterium]